MRINTRFNVGDLVYYFDDNILKMGRIEDFCISSSHGSRNGYTEEYMIHDIFFPIDSIFSTSEDVLIYMKNKMEKLFHDYKEVANE